MKTYRWILIVLAFVCGDVAGFAQQQTVEKLSMRFIESFKLMKML
jgi:hypothetical protein